MSGAGEPSAATAARTHATVFVLSLASILVTHVLDVTGLVDCPRYPGWLYGAFGAAALVGIYCTVALVVEERRG